MKKMCCIKNKIVAIMLMICFVGGTVLTCPQKVYASKAKSIYCYDDEIMNQIYYGFKIEKKNGAYYAKYTWSGKNNTVLLSRNKKMTFDEFGKKLGFKIITNKRKRKITTTEYELKKYGTSALIAFICQDVNWLTGFAAAVATDKALEQILRKPGTYKFVRKQAILITNFLGLEKTHVVVILTKVKKKINGKWKTIQKMNDPFYLTWY
ncbi:hypothetical protein [Anaerosacchariphilus polymeriproducens]|nr:hypothetical protein [Anaerosacchariphilus polymeriproducens]